MERKFTLIQSTADQLDQLECRVNNLLDTGGYVVVGTPMWIIKDQTPTYAVTLMLREYLILESGDPRDLHDVLN